MKTIKKNYDIFNFIIVSFLLSVFIVTLKIRLLSFINGVGDV